MRVVKEWSSGDRWRGSNSGVEGVGQYLSGRPSPLDVLMHVENNLTANLLHSFSFLPILCPPLDARTRPPLLRRPHGAPIGPFLLYPRPEWLVLSFSLCSLFPLPSSRCPFPSPLSALLSSPLFAISFLLDRFFDGLTLQVEPRT